MIFGDNIFSSQRHFRDVVQKSEADSMMTIGLHPQIVDRKKHMNSVKCLQFPYIQYNRGNVYFFRISICDIELRSSAHVLICVFFRQELGLLHISKAYHSIYRHDRNRQEHLGINKFGCPVFLAINAQRQHQGAATTLITCVY